MKTKVTGKYVIGFDGNTHVVFEDGEVVYENDKILFVGHDYPGEVDAHIDGGNAIVSPGFVDLDPIGDFSHALVQSELTGDLKNQLSWSEAYFDERRGETMTLEEEAFKSVYAYSQIIRNGITTAMPITSVLYKKAAETYEETVIAAHNAARLGLRVYLGPSYVSAKTVLDKDGCTKIKWIEDEGRAGLDDAVRFAKTFNGAYGGLINAVFTPERVELITEDVLRDSKRYADEFNCPVRIHAAQTPFEYNLMQSLHKKSTIAYLNDIGFLGENAMIVHAIFASGYSKLEDKSDNDLDILRDTKTTVVHCPVVQAQSGQVLESFGRYVRKGIRMALATDTFPCDMIENIRIGSFLARNKDNDKPENNFSVFYDAATIGAANALGRNDLGRLCVGAKADIIIIDMSGFHIGPLDDPIRTLGLSACGTDVVTSIINGRFVMKDRVIPGLDIPELQRQGQRYFDKFKHGYLDRSDNIEKADKIFKPSYKMLKKEESGV